MQVRTAMPVKCQIAGSTGGRLREIDVFSLPLIPFLYLERLIHLRRRSGIGRYATVAKGPHIPGECWLDVSVRAEREGLQAVARELGASDETVRMVVRAMVAREGVL